MNKSQFITQQLKPYIENPSSCGYEVLKKECQYLTEDGKMCVFGKNLIKPEEFNPNDSAGTLLDRYSESILKPEAKKVNLAVDTWSDMQSIHDRVARVYYSASFSDSGSIRMIRRVISLIEDRQEIHLDELKDLISSFQNQNYEKEK
jgi:hypothetical protein